MLPMLAEKAPEAAPAPCGINDPLFWVVIAASIAIFYFMVIRPQKKQQHREQEKRRALAKGDRVVTNFGLIGRIAKRTEREVTLITDENKGATVTVLIDAVHGLYQPPAEKPEEPDAKPAK